MKRKALMKKCILFFCCLAGYVKAGSHYQFSVDLTKVKNDRLTVTLIPPSFNMDEVIYYLPKIVPGTYEIYDFGRFTEAFRIYDEAGNELPFEHFGLNRWKIKNAKKITKIIYEVEDSWDTDIQDAFVFEPAGTGFDKDRVFLINTYGLFGYFEGMKNLEYRIDITRPAKFYGSTSLLNVTTSGNTDSYVIPDYMQLVDAPMMYNVPDTTILQIGGAQILVSVYSENKKQQSQFIASQIKTILTAQKEYLGGKLPIEKYAFIIYLFKGNSRSQASGALEHSYSSVYYMPEIEPELLARSITNVAAHEFFHIVTPLSIHSEEIGDFDFINPAMSMHLWLYEGVTEYFAGHVQVKQRLINPDDYLETISSKLFGAEDYNDTIPFTSLSKNCLKEYKDQYGNVYEKGALIGLCFDIKLRILSDGTYGLTNLLNDLSKTYGKNKSFKDNELIDEIARLSFPEMKTFFNTYINKSTPLPIKELLDSVGVNYQAKGTVKSLFPFDMIPITVNFKTQRLLVKNENDYVKKIGLKKDDEIVKFNRKKLTLKTATNVFAKYYNMKQGEQLEFVVRRMVNAKSKKIKLKTTVTEGEMEKKHLLEMNPHPTERQLVLRKSWMGF